MSAYPSCRGKRPLTGVVVVRAFVSRCKVPVVELFGSRRMMSGKTPGKWHHRADMKDDETRVLAS